MQSSKRRAVITGIGVIAPNGSDLNLFWTSLCAGRSAAAFISRIDTSALPSKVACPLRGFNPADYLAPATANHYPPAIQYAIAAARNALDDAAFDSASVEPDRLAIVAGTSQQLHRSAELPANGDRPRDTLSILINGQTGSGGSAIAHELGLAGHALSLSTGASTGVDTLAQALALIRDDDVDIALAGAAETPITPGFWGLFCASNDMSRECEEPARAMRPFAANRDGFILGEGAAFLVVEELSSALRRGAPIYAEIAGFGRSFDCNGSNGTGGTGFRSLGKALHRAGVAPHEIDYLNANGTATAENDRAESVAIKQTFGQHAKRLQVSATKPVTGHWTGAAGPLEAAICALAIRHRTIPPTINLTAPDSECDLDYVPLACRGYPVNAAVSLNAGFDGSNTCLVFKKFIHF